MIKINKL